MSTTKMLSLRVPEAELDRLNALTPATRRSELIREAVVAKLDEIEAAAVKRQAEQQVAHVMRHKGRPPQNHLAELVGAYDPAVVCVAVAEKLDRPVAQYTHAVGNPHRRGDFSKWEQIPVATFINGMVKAAGSAILYHDIKRVQHPQVPTAEAFDLGGTIILVTDLVTLSQYKLAAEQQQALQDGVNKSTVKGN